MTQEYAHMLTFGDIEKQKVSIKFKLICSINVFFLYLYLRFNFIFIHRMSTLNCCCFLETGTVLLKGGS